MHRETCVGDESRFDAPRVQASNSAGQTLPQQALPNPWHDSAAATTGVEVDQPGKAAHHFWARATAARDRELRPDLDLLSGFRGSSVLEGLVSAS